MLFKLKKCAKWQKKALLSLFTLSAMVSLVFATMVRAQDNKSIVVVASTMANGLLSSSSSIVISSVAPFIKSITVMPTNLVKLVNRNKNKLPMSLVLNDSSVEFSSASLDNRASRLDNYFDKYRMPLAGYGDKFIEVADSCGIDWRLLPAISVQESTGGKYMRLNNPFGWASAKIGFKDFEEAIEIVGMNLCGLNEKTASYYKDKTTYQKLWSYNGTVNHSYPSRVIAIMEKF